MKTVQDLLKDTVSDYEFQPLFKELKEGVSDFEFQPLAKDQVMDVQEHEQVIRIERNIAEEKSFKISPVVREHRGMNRQEELERERLIQEEVERQLVKVQEQAYKDGFEKGLSDGR